MEETDELRQIPIEQLVEPWILLRPVDCNSLEYLEMKDSLEKRGFLNSISARPCKRRQGMFEIIDGMYRWTCAKEIRLASMPTIIKYNVTDTDVLSLQIQANAVRPETLPCDFARQLKRLQRANPGITMAGMSAMVCKSPGWIRATMDLLELSPDQQKMVDRGEICLQNAYMLVKIPSRFRIEYIDQAKTLTSLVFSPIAASVVKQFKEAVRQGKLDAFFTEDFEPQPYLRSIKDVAKEHQSQLEGPLIVSAEKCKTPMDGWMAALKWIMHLDRESVEDQEIAARSKVRKHFQP